MWIFGYGSLVWKADFPYVKKIIGYIKGYERKFWQASIDHRGVPGKPGRVVTLVPSSDPEAKVWGAAYKIHPRDVAHVVKHLDLREVMGYEKTPVEFFPLPHHPLNQIDVETSSSASLLGESSSDSRPSSADGNGSNGLTSTVNIGGSIHGTAENEKSVHANEVNSISNGHSAEDKANNLTIDSNSADSEEEEMVNQILEGNVPGGHFLVTMYYGNADNEHFIGPAPLEDMVQQIYESSGPSGTNKEYLFNLADAMRQICEEAIDPHLAELEFRVRKLDATLNKKRSGRSTPIEL